MTQTMLAAAAAQSAIRVLLVDDHRSVLWGLRKLIDGEQPLMHVVDEATCRDEAFNGLRYDPDVILLDLDLNGESGLDMVHPLRERSHARVIILTGMRDSALCEQAVMQGAAGLVRKCEPAEVILKAIAHVHAGELWLDRSTAGRVFASLSAHGTRTAAVPDSPESLLTARERRIVAAVVQHKGAPAKVIADALNISGHTLRNHLASIYAKLGIHRRLDLVLYAMEHGLDKLFA
ncbi:MAG TPA: response regulator transcription factor [Burkholderiales bacterium]|nr:response regulator transcription factor [Burkholderiales bacterium]